MVFGGENLVREIVKGVVGFCGALLRAEDQANWRILAGLHPVFAGVVEVHMHLPRICIAKPIYLEIHDQQGFQVAVEEDEIDAEPIVGSAGGYLHDELNRVERELADRSADLDRSVGERTDLNRKLAEVQSNALSLEARLSLIGKETSEDTQQALALKGQVNDLNQAIDEKDKEIAESRALLDRDRDIRNLISARNLYIAEIYDVGQSGDTQKPFGRLFYTKDKSLIFYGYDLDQQPGIKKAGAFQAWGGRGADRQHAVSLGLLYKDDASQKRWVLKSNDAKTISQIDTVFVTVEPEGGSTKPSGKPLLFTYLRLDPNHP